MTTEWEYGLAKYNGWMQPDGTMADVIGGRSVGLREFLEAAAEKGWEFCGVLPSGDPLMAGGKRLVAGGKRSSSQAIAIFKRPTKERRSKT